MRIIFLGATPFATAIFKGLIDNEITPIAILTYPPKESGRGRIKRQNPLAILAQDNNIPYYEIEDYNSEEAHSIITNLKAELGIVIAFKILPARIFNAPTKGMINLHPSMLPALRGAAPLNWAIARGYKQSGLSVFFLNKQIDAGKIVIQKKFNILPEENTRKLTIRIVEPSIKTLIQAVKMIETNSYKAIIQAKINISFAPKIKKLHLKINWQMSANQISNQIRAFSPKPGCFTKYNGKIIKILKSIPANPISDMPKVLGNIYVVNNILYVKTGANFLNILELQPENKKAMNAISFINGYFKPKEADSFE